MISIAIADVQDVISIFNDELEKQRKNIRNNLKELLGKTSDALEKRYISKLLRDVRQIIQATPNELLNLKTAYEKIINTDLLSEGVYSAFRDRILTALEYKTLRSNFYPEYFYNIGIKSCVYCNSQLAVTVVRMAEPIHRAKFQVDHYLAKNRYPCFSISLFNLYPVCASCNNVKGTKKVLFNLYTGELLRRSLFKFSLAPGSRATYLLTRNRDDIQIIFDQPAAPLDYEDYNKLFDIKGIYDTQKDVAEELVIKAEIYGHAYRNTLLNSFNKLFKREDILDRLIIGNYTEEVDIHKRPLAKFMMDISLDVGLIKRKDDDIS